MKKSSKKILMYNKYGPVECDGCGKLIEHGEQYLFDNKTYEALCEKCMNEDEIDTIRDEWGELHRRGKMNLEKVIKEAVKEALNYYDVVGYLLPDGSPICKICFEESGETDEELTPIFVGSEWDYYPICEICGEVIDNVTLTEEGQKYEDVSYS